jgi:hypothetical protein
MAKRKAARARKDEILTLNLPRPLWKVIREAARVAGLTTDQVVSAVLAVALVTNAEKKP